MVQVSVHYWAGAKAAAGVAFETFEAATVAAALEQASAGRADPHFDRVVRASTVMIGETTAHLSDLDRLLDGPVRVEILPPFAGGARTFPFVIAANAQISER